MNQLTGVILAAGEGKRMWPMVTPKTLIPIAGKGLLSSVADDLKAVGIEDQIVVTSKIQKKPLGMADAVLSAGNLSGPTVIVNGGDLIDPAIFKAFSDQIDKTPDKIVLTGWETKENLPGGYLAVKGSKVTGIVEKPEEDMRPSDYLNLVLHYFPKVEEFMRHLSAIKSESDDVYEQALNEGLKHAPAVLVEAKGYFYPLKYPHQLLDITAAILKKLDPKSLIHPSAKIMEGAVVKNSYIGPKVIIGNNCLVRDSIIEAESVIGFNTEIARSYVGPKSWFHSNYVGDSVVEGESNMGSGARLANWRFDGKNIGLKLKDKVIDSGKTKLGAIVAKGAKFGINASVMPGVTIGESAIVGSGLVLNRAVEPGETVLK